MTVENMIESRTRQEHQTSSFIETDTGVELWKNRMDNGIIVFQWNEAANGEGTASSLERGFEEAGRGFYVNSEK